MIDPVDIEEPNELYEHFRFVVDAHQALLRIDKYVMAKIENASRNRIQNAAHAGNILVNDKVVKPNYKVKPYDVISIVMAYPPRDTEIYPENIPISVVYEDNDLMVVNKSPGMVVHPGHGNYTGTLQNALLYYLQQQRPDDPEAKPYLVHRIDKDTSGILLVAKTELAQTRLAKQFFDHSIQRTYIALVWGNLEKDEGTITGNIGRDIRNRLVQAVYSDEEKGRHAVTHYTVLERFGYVTLVECRLETGRTHQIRVHFKHIGHPLFNDEAYGGSEILKGTTFSKYKQFVENCFKMLPRQALHAKTLGFIHPATKKHLTFDSAYPEDMASVIEKWRNYSKNKTLEEN
ncbi:MAG: RluA family pseudouridine synthase [Bacteroidales bacterium]|nr:RluA family pseudouridine synthase [Bacteroidales bacterium]MDD4602614.1 RluA family pseudouridine synthase [Bacteroidales bacterium]